MDYLKSALTSIRMNRRRTVLTMLGIIIGVSSVISILAIGNGMKGKLASSLRGGSQSVITVTINPKKTSKTLTGDDLNAIVSAVPELKGATTKITVKGTSKMHREMKAQLIGTNEMTVCEFGKGIYAGRFYNENDVRTTADVCVLTQVSSLFLFDTFDTVGKTVSIDIDGKTHEMTVIGVMGNSSVSISYAEDDIKADRLESNTADIYVPYTLLSNKYNLADEKISDFYIYPLSGRDSVAASKVKTYTENILGVRGEKAVTVHMPASIMSMLSGIMDSVTLIVSLVAAISLIVGGIGVMNIMTVTVAERTREIGIRKALGARTKSILIQFLIESSLICLIAGFIGMILGIMLSMGIGTLVEMQAVVLPSNILVAVGISVVVGVLSGIYPAFKAARLNPIDALRTE